MLHLMLMRSTELYFLPPEMTWSQWRLMGLFFVKGIGGHADLGWVSAVEVGRESVRRLECTYSLGVEPRDIVFESWPSAAEMFKMDSDSFMLSCNGDP